MASMLLEHTDPVYPEEARAKHMAGAVVLRVLITPEGKVDEVSAITGAAAFRSAAETAVKQWTYKPYQLNGRAVFVDTTVTVNFKPEA